MKVIVIGGSKGTGARAVEQALAKGHEVTAFARSPQKLAIEHPKLAKVAGDFHDAASVASAVRGHDAVISTPGVTSLGAFDTKPDYFSAGAKNVIDAMHAAGVKRLVVLSAIGTNDSRPLLNPLLRFVMIDVILRKAFADHEREEALVRASGLEWVIARPSRLTDGPAKRVYTATSALTRVPSSISRADLADFMVRACEEGTWVKQSVQLGG